MQRYKVKYKSQDDSTETQSVFVVADKRAKALKAFHVKVQGVDENNIVSIEPAAYSESASQEQDSNDTEPSSGINGTTAKSAGAAPEGDSQSIFLGVTGIIILIIGATILVDPTMGQNGKIANNHLLTIGQTLTIVGSLFVAAQWRPR